MRLAVVADRGGETQSGWTVDLSEGGSRCLFATMPEDPEHPGMRAAVGDRLQLVIDLDGEHEVTDEVQVVRVHTRTDGFWEASLRFTEVSERDKDVIRKKVFGVLRRLRAEGHL
jgi:c-di-GMP-binding flagellar brake protein YcgR